MCIYLYIWFLCGCMFGHVGTCLYYTMNSNSQLSTEKSEKATTCTVQCGKSEISWRVYSAATTPTHDRKSRNLHSSLNIKAFKASCKASNDLVQCGAP